MKSLARVIRERIFLTFVVIWAGISMASVAWAMATPMGASPDEPAHIVKAASVVRGQFIGDSTDQPAVTTVMVPEGLADSRAWACYAFQANQTAGCQPPFVSNDKLVPARTSAGMYNPVYYAVVGWPSVLTDNPRVAVYGMRTISAILSSFFFAVAMTAMLAFRRPLIAGFATIAIITPMVLFLMGSVNPNALEISAGAALLSLLLLLVRGPRIRHQRLALVSLSAAGVLLASSRGLSRRGC